MTHHHSNDNIAFTPETLAARWQCSPQHLRDLVNKNRLPSFRVGRLYRIPYNAVLDYECPTMSDKSFSAANGTPFGTTENQRTDEACAPLIVMRPHVAYKISNAILQRRRAHSSAILSLHILKQRMAKSLIQNGFDMPENKLKVILRTCGQIRSPRTSALSMPRAVI
ncbi:helix-turn-helix domain-containing protein [Ochrobactrum vermis]|uniref:Helix-turn-helix domain-containing protein n=1 Tax=Ochrobactrum vermis TaxID=1827297 RepID=A0ABU8PAQ7_9HYPH|nr:helix-turn-helix domain-containing protein [Ochrobactrum vermis]PQZ29828.1 hypothetical protein CQZ93_06395 [Ochrobactrum vermis]